MPKVIRALEVMEKELSDGRPFIVGDAVTMADFFLLPTLFGFALTPEEAGSAEVSRDSGLG